MLRRRSENHSGAADLPDTRCQSVCAAPVDTASFGPGVVIATWPLPPVAIFPDIEITLTDLHSASGFGGPPAHVRRPLRVLGMVASK